MIKTFRIILLLLLFFAVVPAVASVAITALWNALAVPVCGFAAIGFWQGLGFFLLGQLLTGGFALGIFLLGSGIHVAAHHIGGVRGHLHGMTDEQRREFINARRAHFSRHFHADFHNEPKG